MQMTVMEVMMMVTALEMTVHVGVVLVMVLVEATPRKM